MNENIRGQGIDGAQVLQAIPVDGRWHVVDIERSRGISTYDREGLITRIADLIAEGHIYRLIINDWLGDIDRAGNVWYDHEYLSPHQYLPKLITP